MKISITNHALERFNERFHFTFKRKDLEKQLKPNIQIKYAQRQKHTKVTFNIGSIPCIAVIWKTNSTSYVKTIYVNDDKPNGKKYKKKMKQGVHNEQRT
ncbi:MAG: hypothetical protein KAG14_04210 [Mycoplasmataceae bacterium]|nr:hypothetical protein [Mycoplasmataceae bacterium]